VRDLIVTENITLDGVIDASAGWFNVANDAEDDQSDIVAALRQQSEAADAVVFGRVTFEDMRGYWPKQTNDTTGVTDYLNRVIKYVVSSTMGDPQWEHTTVLRGGAFQNEGVRDAPCAPMFGTPVRHHRL
jgi:dihydrofolate reductase